MKHNLTDTFPTWIQMFWFVRPHCAKYWPTIWSATKRIQVANCKTKLRTFHQFKQCKSVAYENRWNFQNIFLVAHHFKSYLFIIYPVAGFNSVYSFDVPLHCSSWFILDFSSHAYAKENEFLSFDVQFFEILCTRMLNMCISSVLLCCCCWFKNEKLFERQPAPKCQFCMEIQFLIDCNGVKRLATRKIGLKYCFQLIERRIVFSWLLDNMLLTAFNRLKMHLQF